MYHTTHPFKAYNPVIFSLFSCAAITTIDLRTFSSPRKQPCTLYFLPPHQSLSPLATPLNTLANTNLLPVSIDLPIWGSSYEWNLTLRALLPMAPSSFIQPNGAGGKESTCQYRRCKRHKFDGVGNGSLLQYSCLENSMERRA